MSRRIVLTGDISRPIACGTYSVHPGVGVFEPEEVHSPVAVRAIGTIYRRSRSEPRAIYRRSGHHGVCTKRLSAHAGTDPRPSMKQSLTRRAMLGALGTSRRSHCSTRVPGPAATQAVTPETAGSADALHSPTRLHQRVSGGGRCRRLDQGVRRGHERRAGFRLRDQRHVRRHERTRRRGRGRVLVRTPPVSGRVQKSSG